MRKIFFVVIALIISLSSYAQSNIVGIYKTIDDNTGEAKSYVQIYQDGDAYFGKIIKILEPHDTQAICEACEGDDHNAPVLGMVIIREMELRGDQLKGGTALDPENGKTYRCKIWLDEDDSSILNVRGYVAFFYRTQQWIRVD